MRRYFAELEGDFIVARMLDSSFTKKRILKHLQFQGFNGLFFFADVKSRLLA